MSRRVLPYGHAAVLVECADLDDALGLAPRLATEVAAVSEVVPGARTLLLRLSRPLERTEREWLAETARIPPVRTAGPEVVIEVDYDGPDLTEVARQTGLDEAGVVAAHTATAWRVAFGGFAPGFAYLRAEHDPLVVSRRTEPRTRVPAGAVGLADAWSGIYPRSGPGGWQLIGRTDAPLWDLDRDPPALLRPGSSVRFVPLR